jgi:tetratricopeptide (TPR) repeat protein
MNDNDPRPNDALKEWLRLAPQPPALDGDHKWHIFLSYRSVNRTWVLHLYDAFKQAGFEVFLDQLEIPAGTSLAGRLNAALSASKSGVIVWSTAYTDSEWCEAEYNTMQAMAHERRGFKFVVVKLSDTKLPPMVRGSVYVDFTDYPDGPQGGELLKLMYGTLGKPLPPEVLLAAQAIDDTTKETLARIHAAREVRNVAGLRLLASTGGPAWQASPLLYSTTAEALIELKEYDEALSVLDVVTRQFRNAIRPIHLKALALARKGQLAARNGDRKAAEQMLMDAQQMLAELFNRQHRDPETLGIYARTWMDRYELTNERAYLEKSRDLYALAFKLTETDYYTGINAAAKSVFLGELDAAAGFAKAVESLVGTEPIPGDYWKSATVAEVQLIQQHFDRAATLYRKAVIDVPNATGNHDSTRTQAERLLAHLPPPAGAREKILAAFNLGGGA